MTTQPPADSVPAPPHAANRPVIDKSDDPFPPSLQFRIRDFRYADSTATLPPVPPNGHPETHGVHLQILRYNARPEPSDPESDWQLRTGYTVWLDIDWRAPGDPKGQWREETWALTAPRGMYTDLSSIPAFARWIVSKSGPHLEASIIHDWLYLKWTDHRFEDKRFSDWVFADAVLAAGLRDLKDFHWFKKRMINFAVQGFGWLFFFKKKMPLRVILPLWAAHLDQYPFDTPVPFNPKNYRKPSIFTRAYAWAVLLFSAAVAVLGLAKIWTTLMGLITPGGLGFPEVLIHWNKVGPAAEPVAQVGEGAGVAILFTLGVLGIALALAVLVWGGGRLWIGLRRALGL